MLTLPRSTEPARRKTVTIAASFTDFAPTRARAAGNSCNVEGGDVIFEQDGDAVVKISGGEELGTSATIKASGLVSITE